MTIEYNLPPRLIAFYLPQYHPIPENDAWWGNGFTEWTNVARARPLFRGHYQPHLPADLGFYDLRVPEVRQAQADMAKAYGLHGFCYYHYWFNGKQLLERPFNEVLSSGSPDLPFCLCWANESWTGIWHGAPDRILIEQTYPGMEDHTAHFYNLLPAFSDKRCIRVEGKPLFIIYKPKNLPEPQKFIDLWQNLAVKNGLDGIYFLGLEHPGWDYHSAIFNGIIFENLFSILKGLNKKNALARLTKKVKKRLMLGPANYVGNIPAVFQYKDYATACLPSINAQEDFYQIVVPNWDNTPRSHTKGFVLYHSTPSLFQSQLLSALSQVQSRSADKKMVFIKSWNEWAEGNHLEPDQKFGFAYLQAIKDIMDQV